MVKILRHNLREIIFVILAFAVMAGAAYFSVGNILRDRLLDRAKEMIFAAEANIRAGLSEAETILLNANYIVQGMIERNATQQEIIDYLTNTTEWMRQREQGLISYYGIYGFINEEFYDSMGLNPGDDYKPQSRPWYQTAAHSGSSVAYTTPYIDWRTGDTVVSAVKNIFNDDERIVGILATDIEISLLTRYVGSLAVASGGYGILVNQNMTLMAHPDKNYIDSQLHSLGSTYEDISQVLRSGEDVLGRRTKDKEGNIEIVFLTRIFNGWYVGIATPLYQFYSDLFYTALILILLGLVLSFFLCYILLRISAAKMRADEENKSKSSFLASMSHEIRTPMNAITGMAELMLREELSDQARSYALDIKQAGNNLISIINDILDFSKIEAGKLEIRIAKYQFSSLINDTVNIVRMRIGDKPIQFNINIDKNIPNNLFGDEIRLRQIFINLLSNAIKYTKRGYIDFTVIETERTEKLIWLKVIVSDTGVGIKPEDQIKLFNEFVQVDVKKNIGIEGTGLGLAITKRLCNSMDGDISFKSEYGKGSIFTIIIPQVIDSEEPLKLMETHKKKSDSSGDINFIIPQTCFLVVDDMPTNLKVAEGLLSPYQAKIVTCSSGIKAIELVKQQYFDLVFMDHMMPEMDGIETTANIRAWEEENKLQSDTGERFSEEKRIPIVALTANAVVGMREMFLENGFDDFLAKPIDISKLDEIINRWIPKEKKEPFTANSEQSDLQFLYELKEALESNKASSDIFDILEKLDKMPLSSESKAILTEISHFVLIYEYDNAIKVIEELNKSLIE